MSFALVHETSYILLFQYDDLAKQCESKKERFEQELKPILFRNRRECLETRGSIKKNRRVKVLKIKKVLLDLFVAKRSFP